jgi:hypothetical protein
MLGPQVGPQGNAAANAVTAAQQMPPPSQPQPAARQQGHESPSLQNAQPPTPTPANKAVPKGKPAKERPRRNKGKGAATPATPNAEPPTPTTPITPHAPPLQFGQQPPGAQPNTGNAPSQPPSQQSQSEQQSSSQDNAPPSAFASIDHAAESSTDVWGADDKWISASMSLPMEFNTNNFGSLGDFGNSGFEQEDIINYGDFLNDSDALNLSEMTTIWDDPVG